MIEQFLSGVTTPIILYLLSCFLLVFVLGLLRNFFLIFSMLSLPATFAHELSHWIAAFLINAQPTKLSIIPQRNGRTYVLGHVLCRNISWYNAWLVGFSPLSLLSAAYFMAVWRTPFSFSALDVGLFYLTAQLLMGSIPSGQDVKIVFQHSMVLIIILGFFMWRSFST